MNIYITCFSNIRYFTKDIIPISTAVGWPWWLYKADKEPSGTLYLNKNSVMIGISEEQFSCKDVYESLEEKCQKNCPYKDKVPDCQFMKAYYNHLSTLNFNEIIDDWKRVAEEVRKINHFQGEPTIVLLVYEAASCTCAERPCLQKWFKENGYELKEWKRKIE